MTCPDQYRRDSLTDNPAHVCKLREGTTRQHHRLKRSHRPEGHHREPRFVLSNKQALALAQRLRSRPIGIHFTSVQEQRRSNAGGSLTCLSHRIFDDGDRMQALRRPGILPRPGAAKVTKSDSKSAGRWIKPVSPTDPRLHLLSLQLPSLSATAAATPAASAPYRTLTAKL